MKLTVGCRCRVLPTSYWKEFHNQEVILIERDKSKFSFIPLENHPEMVTDGSVYYDSCAWIEEAELELIDKNFEKNLPFIDWVEEHQDDFCPDCGTFVSSSTENEHICPRCNCEF